MTINKTEKIYIHYWKKPLSYFDYSIRFIDCIFSMWYIEKEKRCFNYLSIDYQTLVNYYVIAIEIFMALL